MFDFQDEDRIITSTMKNEDIDVENSLRRLFRSRKGKRAT